jgi:hypothetical protein
MDMDQTIVYVDASEVHPGMLDDLKTATKELADFVDAHEPRILAYNVYLSDHDSRINVVHVHPDSASLEYHMEVAGPMFRRFADLVTLTSIDIFGRPSEKVLRLLDEKARLLGRGAVTVHELHAGFSRLESR